MSFEKLFDGLEELEALLDEGPDDKGSAEFLKNVQMEIDEIARQSKTLTVADVDAEFTEDEGANDDAETETH